MKIEAATELPFGPPAQADGPSGVSAIPVLRAVERDWAGTAAEQGTAAKQQANSAAVQRAASELEAHFAERQPALNFRVDDDTGALVVSLIDPDSGEVLRQIPAEEALRMARALKTREPSLLDQRA